MADPAEYYKYDKLNLYFKDVKDCSLDEAGAEKFKKDKSKANVPGTYVQQVQKDLNTLGYVPEKDAAGVDMIDGYYGRSTARAVMRFQRHAARVYRMDASKAARDVKAEDVFKGKADGICNSDTAKEIRKWIDGKLVNPVGRFKIKSLASHLGGKLREDAAEAWEKIVDAVTEKGGTLEGAYGDTLRALGAGKKDGASNFSFHYSGRAVDIRQAFADPPESSRRYYVQKEIQGGETFWRILCKTSKQDGTQGVQVKKGEKKRWDFKERKEYPIPEGYYLDLTAEIESSGVFERIKAQKGWDNPVSPDKPAEMFACYNRTEWWHFQYNVLKQETFLDEMELIGVGEAELRKTKNEAGILKWPTDNHLDTKPG